MKKIKVKALLLALIMLLNIFSSLILTVSAETFEAGTAVSYTTSQSVTITQSGWYYIEAWGGNGGDGAGDNGGNGGESAKESGYFHFNKGDTLYVQVGTGGGRGGSASGGNGGDSGTPGSGLWFGKGYSGGKGGTATRGTFGGAIYGGYGGGGGGAASGVLLNGTAISDIIIASGGGGGGGGEGGSLATGRYGSAGGGSNQYGADNSEASSKGNAHSSTDTNGYIGGWVRHDGENRHTTVAVGAYAGGGAGGGAGGWDGSIGGGGKSGCGGKNGTDSIGINANEGGGGGAGGQSASKGVSLPFTKPDGFNDNNTRTTGVNGQVYITLVKETYKVTYNGNGSDDDDKAPVDDTKYYAPSDNTVTVLDEGELVKDNYTFVGWTKDSDGLGTVYNIDDEYNNKFIITEDTILYAKWAADIYTITYNGNDEDDGEMDEETATYDEYFKLAKNDYTKIGYIFTGWNTETNGTGDDYADEFEFISWNLTDNLNLFAIWSPIDIDIKYDGYSEYDDTGIYGELIGEEPDAPDAPYGHEFDGWNTDPNGLGITWEFEVDTLTVANGVDIDAQTLTLYAQWKELDKFSVTYHANAKGDSVKNMPKRDVYYVGEEIFVSGKTPVRKGYEFDGWNTKKNGNGTPYEVSDSEPITEKTRLYAQWIENSVIIDYTAKTGGSVSVANETVLIATGTAAGSTATPNAGYHFVKWVNAKGKTVSTDPTFIPAKKSGLNVTATYTAVFAEDPKVTIKYKASVGGTVKPTSEKVAPATGTVLGSTATADEDYIFIGWYAAGDTEFETLLSYEETYKPGKVGKLNVAGNYVALFELIPTYEVEVRNSYAAITGDGFYKAGETVTISAGTRSGYTFNGWTVVEGEITLDNSSKSTTTFEMPAEAVIVRARWTEIVETSEDTDDEKGTTEDETTIEDETTTEPAGGDGDGGDDDENTTTTEPAGGSGDGDGEEDNITTTGENETTTEPAGGDGDGNGEDTKTTTQAPTEPVGGNGGEDDDNTTTTTSSTETTTQETIVLPENMDLYDTMPDSAMPLSNGWFAIDLGDDYWQIFNGDYNSIGVILLPEGEDIEEYDVEFNLVPLANIMTFEEAKQAEKVYDDMPPAAQDGGNNPESQDDDEIIENGGESENKTNPKTGDSIYIIIALLILAVAGVVIFRKKITAK